jgi:hypothetical protein
MSLGVAQMSSIDRDAVSAGQQLWMIGQDGLTVPVPCNMDYSRQDPYAVSLTFDPGAGEPVRWFIGRELLTSALHAREGIGDVRAWPSVGDEGEKILVIELGAPHECARFEASAAGIGAFLARTYELVPAGEETDSLNLDAELAVLLSQA